MMRFSRISVLIPTRHRLDRLATMLQSYDRTTMGCGSASELIFRVDEDDAETQDFLLLRHRHRVIVGPRLKGYGSMPTFFNEMAAKAIGDVYLCGNDDMVFQTPHWAELLLRAANQFPDGVFNLGTNTMNADHYPWCIVSRRAVDAMGFYWDPRIFWGDIFLRDVMATHGRCVMVPDVQIDHDWAGQRPDLTYMQTLGPKSVVEGSTSYWATIHKPAVDEAVEKVRGLLCSTTCVSS